MQQPEDNLVGAEERVPVVDHHDTEEMRLVRGRHVTRGSVWCREGVRAMADLKSLKLSIQ